jgi:hypothetical protein
LACTVAHHGDAVAALIDATHRRAQDQAPAAEAVGNPLRDELRPTDEAALLRTARSVDEALEGADLRLVAGRPDVEQDPQQRDIPRLTGEHRLDAEVEEVLPARRRRVALLPGLKGLRVPVGRARCVVRRVERHGAGHVVELDQSLLGVGRARVGRDRAQ